MEASGEQVTDAEVDHRVPMAPEAPPRVPQMGTLGGLAPPHTAPFEIETNVLRIATQIALGRKATYD